MQIQDYSNAAIDGTLENMDQNKVFGYCCWLVISRATSSHLGAVHVPTRELSVIGDEYNSYKEAVTKIIQNPEKYKKVSTLGTIQHIEEVLFGK